MAMYLGDKKVGPSFYVVASQTSSNTKITRVVLTSTPGDNEFEIVVPNGEGGTATFHFFVDINNNTSIEAI